MCKLCFGVVDDLLKSISIEWFSLMVILNKKKNPLPPQKREELFYGTTNSHTRFLKQAITTQNKIN